MDPATEDIISGYIDRGPGGTTLSIPPAMANKIAAAVSRAAEPLVGAGHPVIVLASPSIRAQLKQILDPHIAQVAVLAYNEVVKGLDVESMGLVHLPQEEMSRIGAGAA